MKPPVHEPVKWGTAHYWSVIRSFAGEFTLRDLHARSEGVSIASLRAALSRLRRLGFVAVTRETGVPGRYPTKVFVCARPEARLTSIPDAATRNVQGKRQLFLWRAMRVLTSGWTVAELALAASTDEIGITEAVARGYVSRLARAGIVQVLRRKRSGGHNKGSLPSLYRLTPAANTGPKAPEVHRTRGVRDANRKVWVQRYDAAPAAEASP